MKRKVLVIAAIMAAMAVSAKDRTVVVRSNTGTTTGSTEVTSHEGEGSDTLTVTPGTGITTITVTVRDLDGVLISNDVLSASGDYLELSTPQVPGGCVVTLRDDNGVVFVDYDE